MTDKKEQHQKEEGESKTTVPGEGDATEKAVPEAKSGPGLQEKKDREYQELYDKFLRKQAEFENFRKRMEKERLEGVKYANENLIHDLLPVIDSIEHATDAADKTKDYDALASGIKMIAEQLKNTLEKHGLTGVKSMGEQFDPAHHEAVQVVESEQHGENMVVHELRKGYMLKGRVVRPAMVTVSKKS